ncbi:outer membrane protein OmpA-like peptidoglycan-associated protein [Wenyingzhuangia heitensis]|uniref:Outer membrane protein OmpA-like peptidoglycan-associated protein n=1 Tax=Wenyingzhuangia heitensis TaxID=1487859 RepID=A0ABX0U494_9FLAO|nr:OmpA family protein [Wenyingzhuangia heitensis]NIJ43687.1 outer membrane protein OmpA-like peptidoglycan-associated protein [Wenyingzhuangia heitensis]
MKTKLLLLTVLISTTSFAQSLCSNVVDSAGISVITQNKVSVSTTSASATICLDQDGDGIVDAEDKCPTEAGTLNGCPDTDNDGVIDSKDKCPKIAGKLNGCPDADKDGVADSKDKCPKVAGSLNGCPDTDKDGVIDSKDKCPKVAGSLNGCPDADKDGVADSEDECPTVVGTKAHHGCPELSKEAIATLGKYAKTIQFNTGKSSFKPGVSTTLDKIAEVMKEFDTVEFTVDGYTDSVGDETKNLELSEKRAKAVLDYLATHGIKESRLISKGHGEEDPIAPNNTRTGRAENRRVIITAQH